MTLELMPRCSVSGSRRKKSDEPGTALFERVEGGDGGALATWIYRFEGACVTYRIRFPRGVVRSALGQLRRSVTFVSRDAVATRLERETGVRLDPGSRH